ncbi:pyridoxal-phosphate-dependent aminotransferase family protein [Risungbinella massiliensis]|uniref:pyridoxal-phosphate-dependent aminotransferase family protein n=1 Tax=Risungbinella massiliensis TaxID=1329796 RepID=UPI0005CBDE45|nr:alanine--glyoxylate aminotransferase family protein [Risungbinella massiliensis]
MTFAEKFHLRIPGPTPIPPRVANAMNAPMMGHRSKEAGELFVEVSQKLKPVFGTHTDPFWISGSGTSALEAAVVNCLAPGEEALVVVTGSFGDRFAKITERYGYTIHRLDIPWGQTCTRGQLQDALATHPNVRAVFLTHCETSTGILNDIQALSNVIHQHSNALVIVDAVSSLGAVPFAMDEWKVDVVVTGSQKAMMLPPGLAFLAVSQRAWNVIEENPSPRFYLDLIAYRKQLEAKTTPYTPALSLLYGAKEALTMLEEEGLLAVYDRHRLLQKMTRQGVKALKLELLSEDEIASPTVTAIRGDGTQREADALRNAMKKRQMIVAGGQQQLKGKVFRLGHMGYCDPQDVITMLSVLEMGLADLGVKNIFGRGVQAAQEVWFQYV